MQHFNEPQNAEPVVNVPLVALVAEQEDDWQTSVFAFLSPQGQQVVGEYLAHLEQGLAKADFASKALSTFERDDALCEIQNHLASLIVAYQELGDDEPKAIRSAIAQFGAARDVSTGLRRAERRTYRIAVGSEVVVPLLLFSLALTVPVIVVVCSIPLQWIALYKIEPRPFGSFTGLLFNLFGWPALILLPFLAGAFAGNRKGKMAVRGLCIAFALAIGTALLLNWLLHTDDLRYYHENTMRYFVERQLEFAAVGAFWLASACLGMAMARGAYNLKRKRKAA